MWWRSFFLKGRSKRGFPPFLRALSSLFTVSVTYRLSWSSWIMTKYVKICFKPLNRTYHHHFTVISCMTLPPPPPICRFPHLVYVAPPIPNGIKNNQKHQKTDKVAENRDHLFHFTHFLVNSTVNFTAYFRQRLIHIDWRLFNVLFEENSYVSVDVLAIQTNVIWAITTE